MNWRQSI